jgi:hypothetical protein
MWPSELLAGVIQYWANWVLLVSLAVGVMATALVVWMGNVKEEYLKLELGARAADAAHANLQIAALDVQSKQLEKDTASANAALAAAEERTAKLAIELETQKARTAEAELQTAKAMKLAQPRYLPHNEFVALLKERPTGTVEILYAEDDLNADGVATQLERALKSAGWTVKGEPHKLRADSKYPYDAPKIIKHGDRTLDLSGALPGMPSWLSRGRVAGVILVANKLPNGPELDTPAGALTDALGRVFLKGTGSSLDTSLPDGLIRIVVGVER